MPAVGTPPYRGLEGTLPDRILRMWNVGTPSGSGLGDVSGKPTARKVEFPSGKRMAQQANAGVPKGDRKPGQDRTPSVSRITGRIPTGLDARSERVLTWAR